MVRSFAVAKVLLLGWVVALAAGCAAMTTGSAARESAGGLEDEVREIRPGILQGYLTEEQQLDSKLFVLPAPEPGSPMQALDTAWSERMLALRGSERWSLAISDADLSFPAAAGHFSCALGIEISEANTPALYMLLRRSLTDVGLATYSAKNAFQRARPFMRNDQPICTPEDEEALRKDGSYPSGHTAVGWGWALILTELAPERTDALLARGRSYGESRNVCNVHWYSDVVAGRLVAAGAVARLHADETFQQAMAAARRDVERARASGLAPEADCEAEARSLAQSLLQD
jgi:acid phosphatase (class A)